MIFQRLWLITRVECKRRNEKYLWNAVRYKQSFHCDEQVDRHKAVKKSGENSKNILKEELENNGRTFSTLQHIYSPAHQDCQHVGWQSWFHQTVTVPNLAWHHWWWTYTISPALSRSEGERFQETRDLPNARQRRNWAYPDTVGITDSDSTEQRRQTLLLNLLSEIEDSDAPKLILRVLIPCMGESIDSLGDATWDSNMDANSGD